MDKINGVIVTLSSSQYEMLEALTNGNYAVLKAYENPKAADLALDNSNRHANYVTQWFSEENLGEITPLSLATELDIQRKLIGG